MSFDKLRTRFTINVLCFLLGALIGASTVVSLYHIAPTPGQRSTETLDFLITEWTRQRDIPDTLRLAQIPRRIEFPEVRSGHFPDTIHVLADEIQRIYNIPKAIILAQWALESNWGRSDLGARNTLGHTLRAVRPHMAMVDSVMRRDRIILDGQIVDGPVVAFALYSSTAQCFDTHGKYLTRSRRYKNALKQTNSEAFARELGRAGYAADPDYALKLIAIMRRYKLDA